MDDTALIATISAYYGIDAAMLQAIVDAEGGREAYIRAIECSRPEVSTFEVALAVGAKTVRNALGMYPGSPFVLMPHTGPDPWTGENGARRHCYSHDFIARLGSHWAPIGAANDPKNLNLNWVPNVLAAYRKHAGVSV